MAMDHKHQREAAANALEKAADSYAEKSGMEMTATECLVRQIAFDLKMGTNHSGVMKEAK